MNQPALKSEAMSVSALNRAIKMSLEPGFRAISVKGEVGDYRLQASGHEYFTLKDDKSTISCVFFKGYRAASGVNIKRGDQLIVEGDLGVYEVRGSYQVIVKKARAAGVGDLLMQIHALKEELAKQGYFAQEKKRPLPRFPKTIGVVTSESGSVIRDIIHVLSRRYSGFQLILNPVRVQGAGAAEEIATAIHQMNQHQLADVLIIGRGGGSLEDLMPFNERCVADAIFESEIPIISAVGHETDHSIADLVSDCRAPTPSAAAEIVSREKSALKEKVESMAKAMHIAVRDQVRFARERYLSIARAPMFADPYLLIKDHVQKVDDMEEMTGDRMSAIMKEKRLKLDALQRQMVGLNPMRQLKEHSQRIQTLSEQLDRSMVHALERKGQRVQSIRAHLASINPKKLLSRGYCIPFAQNSDSVIMSAHSVAEGDRFRLLMHDGKIEAKAEEVTHDNSKKSSDI